MSSASVLVDFIFITWLVFWTYWLIAAFGAKRSRQNTYGRFIGVRIVLFVVIVWLLRSSNRTRLWWDGHWLPHNSLPLEIIGVVLFVAGLSLALWARLYLGKNWGMPMSEKDKPELVTSGPYRFVRHPIYTGVMFAALGTGLTVSLVWLLLFVFCAVYFTFSAFQEEKYLIRQFGKSYIEYRRRSKMLIPFVF